MMKLSILDQSPVLSNSSNRQALQESLKLAQLGEKLGYTRYWIAEHHAIKGLSCQSPEVMLSYIGAHTDRIRLGAGAILLPHYKPFKVAETFNMLATIFPNRIDLGIGRAPGGSAEATQALSEKFLEEVWKMPQKITELLHFLRNDFPEDSLYLKITTIPVPEKIAVPWLLGTSVKSARLAAELGIAYAFGQFMSEKDGIEIISEYQKNFLPVSDHLKKPYTIVAISAICLEESEKAWNLGIENYLRSNQIKMGDRDNYIANLSLEEKEKLKHELRKHGVYGSPEEVKDQLLELQRIYQVDEFMIVTIPKTYEERKRSYRLIADQMLR